MFRSLYVSSESVSDTNVLINRAHRELGLSSDSDASFVGCDDGTHYNQRPRAQYFAST